jgi:hypothetical protein
LVPAVRARMQRLRFLTVTAVGALMMEGLEDNALLLRSGPIPACFPR